MLLLFTQLSCQKSDIELTSNYETYVPSFTEKVQYKLQYGKWTYTIGTNLTLNKDATFDMTTCGNYIKGNWHIYADTLFLQYQDMSYRIDSLNYIKEWKDRLNTKHKIAYYLIKDKYLERGFIDAKNRYVLTKLVQVKTAENQ